MPCEPIIENGKVVGFICSRSREKPKPPPPCYKCGKPSTKLCDFLDWGKVATCDKPMCDACANHVGEDTDFCDEHNNEFSIFKTTQVERFLKSACDKKGDGET